MISNLFLRQPVFKKFFNKKSSLIRDQTQYKWNYNNHKCFFVSEICIQYIGRVQKEIHYEISRKVNFPHSRLHLCLSSIT